MTEKDGGRETEDENRREFSPLDSYLLSLVHCLISAGVSDLLAYQLGGQAIGVVDLS